jgi:hypothetical protein
MATNGNMHEITYHSNISKKFDSEEKKIHQKQNQKLNKVQEEKNESKMSQKQPI